MGKILKVKAMPADEKYVKDIVTDYDELSERCDEIDLTKKNTEIQDIILHLKNTIRAGSDISGLSANQIGFKKRVICLNFDGDIRSFINPIITSVDGFELSRETCHSIPGKTFIRPRNNKIKVTYMTPLAKIESVELMGKAAIVFQHHVDHLDGLLLNDIGLEIDDDFDNATEQERIQIIDMYLDSIDLNRQQIEADIESDPEAKKMSDGVRFIQSVQSGQTKIEEIPWTEEEIKMFEEAKTKFDEKNKK